MPSETADIRPPPPVEIQNQIHQQLSLDPAAAAAAAPITMQPPKPTDLLPCPRCGSGSTKFCYYNNYNLSQPRYFCKGCRRYWTQGGTLRCVPVGGGSRKNASSYSASKRSRSSSASSTATTASTNSSNSTGSNPTVQEPAPVSASGSELIKVENNNSTTTAPYGLNLNEKFEPVITDSTGNFMSLLNCQETPMLGMNGYGSGFGYGFYDMGLGYSGRVGPSIWSYPGIVPGHVADGAAGVTGVTGGDANPGCNAWQVGHDVGGGGGNGGGAGGGVVDDGGDYFSWPGLAISTPGKTFK